MNTDNRDRNLNAITEAVIGAAHRVSNGLGCGFLEKVYENALALELRLAGRNVQQQHAVDVRYRTEIVGNYVADLLVDNEVIVELKVADILGRLHPMQCLNYLRASGKRLALLLNLGRPKVDVERVISGY